MLSEDQIRTISKDIMFDIQRFIEEHQLEYNLFLKKEKDKENNKNVQKKQVQ